MAVAHPLSLIQRPTYLERALAFRDTDLVKVVTGVRRCGKSSLLELVREHIAAEDVPGRTFVSVNLEARGLGIRTDTDLYDYVRSRLAPSGRTYVFIDEVQRVEGWHDVINSLRVEFDVDLYVTGSNAFLLSSELSTYLSGRYVEIAMRPLTLTEYCDFTGLTFDPGSSVAMADGVPHLFDDVLSRFLRYGGMPGLAVHAGLELDQRRHEQYFDGIYEAVIQRDILGRERAASARRISDTALLRRVCTYLADTVGNQTSTTKMAGALTAAGHKTTAQTVSSYVTALADAYLVYPCSRYDLHGKQILSTMPKYYLVDTGLASYLGGYRGTNLGFTFENAVFLQLLYEGWSVHVGRLYGKEVDFVATRDGRRIYIQVTDEMMSPATRERELAPLRTLRDAYPKVVVVRQGTYEPDIDGIRIVTARDFFLPAAPDRAALPM